MFLKGNSRNISDAETSRFSSGIKNLNLNNLNCQLNKFYMESTRGYLNFSLVLSSCYIKIICSHLNLTKWPYTIYAIFVLLLFKIAKIYYVVYIKFIWFDLDCYIKFTS